ncbi:pheophorbide a oxygenase, partial [Haematococcus lacustris]
MDMQFEAPFKVKYQFLASQRVVQFLAVPTRPGEAKFFFSSQSRPSSPPAWAPWGQPVATWLGNLAIGPEAMEHLHQRHATLDGDAYLLHR